MPARRELLLAALLCAAGAALVIVATGRQWAEVNVVGAGTPISPSLTGRDLAGPAAAFGWAGLAGLAALIAVRGRARVAVGAALIAFGVGASYDSVAGIRRAHVLSVVEDKSNLTAFLSTEVHTGPWWVVSVAGGVLLAAAGLLTIVRGGRWPGMSARYEPASGDGRPAAAADPAAADPAATGSGASGDPSAADPARLWKSLDRGEDPTDRRGPGDSTGSHGRPRGR